MRMMAILEQFSIPYFWFLVSALATVTVVSGVNGGFITDQEPEHPLSQRSGSIFDRVKVPSFLFLL